MQNVITYKHKIGTMIMITGGKFAGVFGKVTGHSKSLGNTKGTMGKVYPTYNIDAMWYLDDTGCFRRLTVRRATKSVSSGYTIASTMHNLGETQITEVMSMDIIRQYRKPVVENFTGGVAQFSKSFPYLGHEFPIGSMQLTPVPAPVVKPVEPVKIETKIAQASGFDSSEFYIESNGKMVKATEETIREIMKTHKVIDVPVFARKVVSVFDLI